MKQKIFFGLITILLLASCEVLDTDGLDWTNRKIITSPDDSQIPSSIKKLIHTDAATLALRDVIKDPEAKYNLVEIPADLIEIYYRGLIHIYNAKKHPPYDKISSIHVFPSPNVTGIVVMIDTTYEWTKSWKRGDRLTGNASIDSIMEKYNLQLNSCYYDLAALYSLRSINTYALSKKFEGIDGVRFSELNGYMGDGNDIQAVINESHILYVFSIGWGDCPSGCMSRHYWDVAVEFNGAVKLIREYGEPLP